MKNSRLYQALVNFKCADGVKDNLPAEFEEVAQAAFYSGYFLVNRGTSEEFRIELTCIEFYYHEDENNIKDPNKYLKGSEEFVYPVGAILPNPSGIDVLFDNKEKKCHISFLIRGYRTREKDDSVSYQNRDRNNPYWKTQDLWYDLFGNANMLSAGQFNIEWVDNGIDYGNPEVYTMKRIKSQSSFDDERTWAYMKYDIQRFGSAAHLHYYLKCRKDELNKAIQEQINHHEEIRWILNESVGKERAGLGFLSKILGDEKTDEIIHRFNGYGINKPENWQHWDAIFTIGDTVYLLEAKARLNESNKNENGGSSKNAIINFFKDQFPDKNVESWLGKYYQLANRLSMAVMLNRCGIKTKVVYLFFENGFKRIDGNKLDDQSATREDFENELIHKLEGLGITNEQVENLLAKVFVDVEK